jgi:sialate O-acetylesterase
MLFGDHMVLQQEMALPVWGWADAGEKVTVTIGTESATATAGADGTWMVKLPPLPNGAPPVTVTVAGKNKLTFSDVLVGDVWLCSGQSNMEFSLSQAHNVRDVLPTISDPQLRFFVVERTPSIKPATDIKRELRPGSTALIFGSWLVCDSRTAVECSAVAYFFGHELRTTLNRPVGLIESSWGGTPAQSWTSLAGLQKEPSLQAYVDGYNKQMATYNATIGALPAQQAAYKAALDKWNQDYGNAYNTSIKAWNDATAQALIAKQPLPKRPAPPAVPQPRPPPDPNGNGNTPSALFNGMIAPLIPFAIKGAIWYQGESNAMAAQEYRTLFPGMITDWRQHWGEGDFPFLFVELAGYRAPQHGADWPVIREAQIKALALPNTGLASAVDIGDPTYIHPADKYDVGLRLALAARHVAYGQNLVYSGPMYDAMKVEGNAIRVSFTQTGGGLVIGKAPWIPGSMAKTPLSTTDLEDFQIAGADHNWVPAQAKIDGDSVVVSSPQVAQPVAVRYGWANSPRINLYNKEGLPASPFRTDDWPSTPTDEAPPRNAAPATTNSNATPTSAPQTTTSNAPKP